MRKRTKEVKVRLTEAELKALNEAYVRAGLGNREAFLRQVIAGIRIYERPPLDTPLLIRQIRRLSANLDQMAHWTYAHGYAETKVLRILCSDIRQLELLFHDWLMYPEKDPDELTPRPLHTTEEYDQAMKESDGQDEFNRALEEEALRDQYMEELLAREQEEENKPAEEPLVVPSEVTEQKAAEEPVSQQPDKKKSWFRPRH